MLRSRASRVRYSSTNFQDTGAMGESMKDHDAIPDDLKEALSVVVEFR